MLIFREGVSDLCKPDLDMWMSDFSQCTLNILCVCAVYIQIFMNCIFFNSKRHIWMGMKLLVMDLKHHAQKSVTFCTISASILEYFIRNLLSQALIHLQLIMQRKSHALNFFHLSIFITFPLGKATEVYSRTSWTAHSQKRSLFVLSLSVLSKDSLCPFPQLTRLNSFPWCW